MCDCSTLNIQLCMADQCIIIFSIRSPIYMKTVYRMTRRKKCLGSTRTLAILKFYYFLLSFLNSPYINGYIQAGNTKELLNKIYRILDKEDLFTGSVMI